MKFASDAVRSFRQYAKDNLSAEELVESRKLIGSRKDRHGSGQELTEAQQKVRDGLLTKILEESHSRQGLRMDGKEQVASSDLGRPKVQYPAKF